VLPRPRILGGPSELNATCKAYFAKACRDDANAPHLTAARETIHRLGGWSTQTPMSALSCARRGVGLGACSRDSAGTDASAKTGFSSTFTEMSSWTRGIVIPMAILSALRPDWRLPEHATWMTF